MTRGEKIREKLRREKLRWSKLYTFNCARSNSEPIDFADPFSGLQGSPRMVYCNEPSLHRRKPLYYPSNYISTTKYNIITFLPKAIFEQFRRVANLYFLLAAILSLTPIAPFSAVSMIAPLAFVVGLSMAKEGLEDWRRFMQDMKVNRRKVSTHKGDGNFRYKKWHRILVGDIVKVEKDHFFPADLLLLSSSYEDGICYVETMNLDGETNLKVKRALDVTLPFDDEKAFKDFSATVRCENPNPSLYTFVGNLEYEKQVYSLDPNQILLRDSKLRNTSYIYGVVVFTGHDSKVMQNSTARLRLAGPTSFAPIIEMAMTIVENSGGQYHVLLIIADGQVTRSVDTESGQLSSQERKTVDAIVKASDFPLSIILVGVGDGPWDMMKEFDDNIPARSFDNFQFVNFTEIMLKNINQIKKDTEFALAALMEIPSQYNATLELGILGRRSGKSPERFPLPPPLGTYDASSSGYKNSHSTSFQRSSPPPSPYIPQPSTAPPANSSSFDNKVCPICLTNPKDMAFGCGHQTCCECGPNLQTCPICRSEIHTRIKLY